MVKHAPAYYGLPWNADSLDNLEIGFTGNSSVRRVAFRFRAPTTSTVSSLTFAVAYGSGYSAGTGGSVKVALQADDGTGNHFPTGTDIASVTNVTANGTADTEQFVTWTFGSPPSVTKGTIYHFVMTNTDGSPTTNWVSFDGTYNNPTGAPTQAQPTIPDTDWYCLRYDSGTWTKQAQVSPSPVEVIFGDGTHMGQSVGYTPVNAAVRNVGGTNNAVRIKFVPSQTITIKKMWARLYRQSSTSQPLSYLLKNNSGTTIGSGTVAALSFPSATAGAAPSVGTWNSVSLSPSVTLLAGSTYTFELWSTAETTFYQAYPLQTQSEFTTSAWSPPPTVDATQNAFNDGHWEYTTNAGGTWSMESADPTYKGQMYFESG